MKITHVISYLQREYWDSIRFPLIPLPDILEIEKMKIVPVDILLDAFKYHAVSKSDLQKEDILKHFSCSQTTPRTSRKPKAVIFGAASPSVVLSYGNKTASSNAPEGRTVLGFYSHLCFSIS